MHMNSTKQLRRTASILALAAALGATPAAVSFAASEAKSTSEATPAKAASSGAMHERSQNANQMRPQSINLVRASTLIGRQFAGQAGEKFGDIEYLLIEPTSGKIVFAMMGTGGWLNNSQDLVAVPLDAIKLAQENSETSMRLVSDRETLEKAPRITPDTLTEMTKPMVVENVYSYWGIDNPDSNTETSDKMEPATQTSASSREQSDGSKTTATDKSGKRYTLVGRDYVTTLMPPLVSTVKQIRGATLVSAESGDRIGQVEDLVIDIDRATASYALIEHGGWFGIATDLAPVPYRAMRWTTDNQFTIQANEERVKNAKTDSNMTEPANVDVADVGALYERYNVKPHWAMNERRAGERSSQVDTASDKQTSTQ